MREENTNIAYGEKKRNWMGKRKKIEWTECAVLYTTEHKTQH